MKKLLLIPTATLLLLMALVTSGPALAASGPQTRTQAQPQAHAAALKSAKTYAAAYDPNDPYQSGCSQGAYDAIYRTIGNLKTGTIATIENWYSPRCVKNWAEIEWNKGAAVQTYIHITNFGSDQCYPTTGCPTAQPLYTGGYSPSWTDMVDGHNLACVDGGVMYQGQWYTFYNGNGPDNNGMAICA
jgi:hypothetical protein